MWLAARNVAPARAEGKRPIRAERRTDVEASQKITQPTLPHVLLLAVLLSLGGAPDSVQQERRLGSLKFVYWPAQAGLATALAEADGGLLLMPGLPDDVLLRGEIAVILAPSPAAFDSLAPGAPDWSAGIAFPEGDTIVLPTFGGRAAGRPLRTILRHELAHVALSRHLGSGVPRWFHEGYAQLASGSWGAGEGWTLRFAILFGQLPSLDKLGLDFRGSRLTANHAYLLSYTAVDFLRRTGGSGGFALLLDRWRETGDLDLALRRTYGLTQSQFERLWRRDVGRRFGWLLVLTQTAVYWTLMTILLLILGYWKKRRNRQKLAALEAAVREAEATMVDGTAAGEDFGEQGRNPPPD